MCVCIFKRVAVVVGGLHSAPVLCRRGVIAVCPSMTLRAVGQRSVLCWAVCPLCWKWCADRHVTVTWLMYMAGFPHCCLGTVSPSLRRLLLRADDHHFGRVWSLLVVKVGWQAGKIPDGDALQLEVGVKVLLMITAPTTDISSCEWGCIIFHPLFLRLQEKKQELV